MNLAVVRFSNHQLHEMNMVVQVMVADDLLANCEATTAVEGHGYVSAIVDMILAKPLQTTQNLQQQLTRQYRRLIPRTLQGHHSVNA